MINRISFSLKMRALFILATFRIEDTSNLLCTKKCTYGIVSIERDYSAFYQNIRWFFALSNKTMEMRPLHRDSYFHIHLENESVLFISVIMCAISFGLFYVLKFIRSKLNFSISISWTVLTLDFNYASIQMKPKL